MPKKRAVPTREQFLLVARELGAVLYSPPPFRAIRGVSFTFDQLDVFVRKMINPNVITADRSEGATGSKSWNSFTSSKAGMKLKELNLPETLNLEDKT